MVDRILVIISRETLSTLVGHPLGEGNFFKKNFALKWVALQHEGRCPKIPLEPVCQHSMTSGFSILVE
jgi:hypothetical protein